MNEPLISIIVPIYNSESQLGKCIDSLTSQTYRNLEIILVDDGSKDSSWDICKAYEREDSRIKAIHKENGGVSSARNVGIRHATGEYVGFLDSDDYVSPELYSDLVSMLNEYDGLDGIRYQFRNVTNGELLECSSSNNAGVITFDSKLKAMRFILIEKEFPSVALFMFRRDKIKHAFNEHVNTAEDYLFMMHFIMGAEKVCITNNVYYYYVYNQNSITRSNINLEKSLSYLRSQLGVCRVREGYIQKYGLIDLEDDQKNDIRQVIENNINNLFPEISYNQYKRYVKDIASLRDFRFFNKDHSLDSVINPHLSVYLSKSLKKKSKAVLRKIVKR